jgi:hypothetical protein
MAETEAVRDGTGNLQLIMLSGLRHLKKSRVAILTLALFVACALIIGIVVPDARSRPRPASPEERDRARAE